MLLTIRTVEEILVRLDLQPTTTIHNIKSIIQKMKGIPIGQQVLIYDEMSLKDCLTLKDCELSSNAIIFLVLIIKHISDLKFLGQ